MKNKSKSDPTGTRFIRLIKSGFQGCCQPEPIQESSPFWFPAHHAVEVTNLNINSHSFRAFIVQSISRGSFRPIHQRGNFKSITPTQKSWWWCTWHFFKSLLLATSFVIRSCNYNLTIFDVTLLLLCLIYALAWITFKTTTYFDLFANLFRIQFLIQKLHVVATKNRQEQQHQ